MFSNTRTSPNHLTAQGTQTELVSDYNYWAFLLTWDFKAIFYNIAHLVKKNSEITSIVNFLVVWQLPVATQGESLNLKIVIGCIRLTFVYQIWLAILERTQSVTVSELYVSKEEVVMSCVHVTFFLVPALNWRKELLVLFPPRPEAVGANFIWCLWLYFKWT